MTDVPTLLTELDALAAKATPGPWENSDGFVRSTARGNTYEAPGMTVTTSCQWVAECRDGEAFYNPDGNASYIAALANAYPLLRAEILRLREALEPFARIAGGYDPTLICEGGPMIIYPDDDAVLLIASNDYDSELLEGVTFDEVTVGDLRRARATLKGEA